MASGNRVISYNTQERALSVDQNRAQAFANRDQAELFRYMLDVTGNDDLDAGSVISEPSTSETPLRAEIINGLLVRPQAGNFNLLVDPGVVYAMAPDGGADDSNYKYIRDAGVTVPGGAFVMATNGGGSIRIDVIECRVNPVPTTVTDNRDIFNAVTNLFAASVVTKETAFRLEYRVRQGTIGAGMPAHAAGWLPLAVASVPPGAASNDAITFWDVRPLISDRHFGVTGLTRDMGLILDAQAYVDVSTSPGASLLRGEIDAVATSGRRVGGRMRRGSPGTDADSIDLALAANWEGGVVAVAGLVHLYLATPFGLPRWAMYAPLPAARVPRSPRGIPIMSSTPPQHQRLTPSAGLTLPTSTGLGATTTTSATLVLVTTAGAGVPQPADLKSRKTVLRDPIAAGVATSMLAGSAQWDLTPGTHYPHNARRLLLRVGLSRSIANGTAERLDRGMATLSRNTTLVAEVGPSGDGAVGPTAIYWNNTGGAQSGNYNAAFWQPVPTRYPSTTDVASRQFEFSWSGTYGAPSAAVIEVLGWEM